MRNLEQTHQAQNPQPAQIHLAEQKRQQARKDGNQVDQSGEAEDIFDPPPERRAMAAGLISGHAPDAQDILDSKDRNRNHFEDEGSTVLSAERTDRSIETANRFSRIIVDRNLSQMRLARSPPTPSRQDLKHTCFLVTIGRSIPTTLPSRASSYARLRTSEKGD